MGGYTTPCAMLLGVAVCFWCAMQVGVAARSSAGESMLAMPMSSPLTKGKWSDVQAKLDVDAIIKEAFSSSTVYERLAYMTDTFGPRLSGSSSLERALDWAKDAIQRDGLNVYEEPVKIPSWVRGREYATLLSPRVKNIRMLGLGGSISTPNGKALIAKALVVSSFEELEHQNHEAEGREASAS